MAEAVRATVPKIPNSTQAATALDATARQES